jgi:hypothetical protein
MKTVTSNTESTNQLDTSNEQVTDKPTADIIESTGNEDAHHKQSSDNVTADKVETTKETTVNNVVSDWLKPKMTTSINAEYIGKIKTVLAAMKDEGVNNVTYLIKKLVEHYLTTASQFTELKREITTLTELNNSNEDAYHNSLDKITMLDKEIKDLQFENMELKAGGKSEKGNVPVPTPDKVPVPTERTFMQLLGF